MSGSGLLRITALSFSIALEPDPKPGTREMI